MRQISKKSLAEETAVVILAAGKGSRMGRSDLAKVCFEIDNVPAINRLIDTFRKNRFRRFLVVVGSMAEQVMATIGKEHPQALFVLQEPQLGTGHAGKIAAEALQTMGHSGPVLLTPGDKYIEPEAVDMLMEGYIRQQADFALLTIPRTKTTAGSSGRVFLDADGQVRGIIEKVDINRQAIVDELRKILARQSEIPATRVMEVARQFINNPKKLASAVPLLIAAAKKQPNLSRKRLEDIFAEEGYALCVDGKHYTAQQMERACTQFNPSLYLFNADTFYRGMGLITNDNAQGEYYITDAVSHLSHIKDEQGGFRYRVRAVPADRAEMVQGFNSPEELLAIQDYVRRGKIGSGPNAKRLQPQLSKKRYTTAAQWIDKLEKRAPSLKRWLTGIYGKHEGLHETKIKELLRVLKCYGRRFSFDDKVVIVRAPGRINLMGRHVDHRGGFNNFLALDRETLAVAGLRDDDAIVACSTQPSQFKPGQFSISELIGKFAWSDWINFVNSDWVRNLLYSSPGDWTNYIKAAMLRVQHEYQDLKIRGMNIAVYGSVPIAAGLSSSSTIVVATLQAAIALNNLELTSQQFIDLCGQGEWFVGSRGGAGDHAAIYLGQRGKIAQVGYLPFRVERVIDAPPDYQVMIANSHVKAAKSEAAKHQFNSRISGYNLGLALLRQRCPQIADMLEHVRDLNPDKLGCSISDLYRYLLQVPEIMTRRDFANTLSGEHRKLMEANFATHQDPGEYHVRGVLMFGAAECLRSSMCMDYLANGRIDQFGELMKISHDGDRVSRAANGQYVGDIPRYSDEKMNQLIADLAGEDPQRVLDAQLYMQPGSYACSTEEIDRMVDIVSRVPGVAGAQIAGAGLGGCIMILTRKDAVDNVQRALNREYYKPRKLPAAAISCLTVDGAGLAEF